MEERKNDENRWKLYEPLKSMRILGVDFWSHFPRTGTITEDDDIRFSILNRTSTQTFVFEKHDKKQLQNYPHDDVCTYKKLSVRVIWTLGFPFHFLYCFHENYYYDEGPKPDF